MGNRGLGRLGRGVIGRIKLTIQLISLATPLWQILGVILGVTATSYRDLETLPQLHLDNIFVHNTEHYSVQHVTKTFCHTNTVTPNPDYLKQKKIPSQFVYCFRRNELSDLIHKHRNLQTNALHRLIGERKKYSRSNPLRIRDNFIGNNFVILVVVIIPIIVLLFKLLLWCTSIVI